jgi:alanine dehydrogenase
VTQLLDDDDVRARLTPELALDGARQALIDAHRGTLEAPPRAQVAVGGGSLVFTAGGYAGGVRGTRIYLTGSGDSDQAVLVWGADGRLAGCVVGVELGARRTGALGSAAAAALAPPDVREVAVVGSGRQAWTQLWALTALYRPSVRVFSPNPVHRAGFADRAGAELGLQAAVAGSARAAVEGADIVILATRAERPVIQPEWIAPGTHVTAVGPKTLSAHECPPGLADGAAVVVSDSPDQAAAYGEPFFTSRPLTHLGAVLAGQAPGRGGPEDITLYASTGLAGSEVVIASRLLAAA